MNASDIMLRIYCTVFNNADLVESCIRSLQDLKPYRLYVVDNYSDDGTYGKLRRHREVIVKRVRCKRGQGRDIALGMLLEESSDNEPVMYIDLDTIYGKTFVRTTLRQIKLLKHGEIRMLFNGLSTARTNRELFWRNLNIAEDWERLARARASGIKIVSPRRMWRLWRDGSGKWLVNRKDVGFQYSDRERRYSGGGFAHAIRMFKLLVDYERGVADKSFDGFYEKAARRSVSNYVRFGLAFVIARVLGVYSYDSKLNNREYSLGFATDIKRKF